MKWRGLQAAASRLISMRRGTEDVEMNLDAADTSVPAT
jgi:hypothetical protein